MEDHEYASSSSSHLHSQHRAYTSRSSLSPSRLSSTLGASTMKSSSAFRSKIAAGHAEYLRAKSSTPSRATPPHSSGGQTRSLVGQPSSLMFSRTRHGGTPMTGGGPASASRVTIRPLRFAGGSPGRAGGREPPLSSSSLSLLNLPTARVFENPLHWCLATHPLFKGWTQTYRDRAAACAVLVRAREPEASLAALAEGREHIFVLASGSTVSSLDGRILTRPGSLINVTFEALQAWRTNEPESSFYAMDCAVLRLIDESARVNPLVGRREEEKCEVDLTILRALGSGEFGSVSLARIEGRGEDALAALKRPMNPLDPLQVRTLEREAEILAHLGQTVSSATATSSACPFIVQHMGSVWSLREESLCVMLEYLPAGEMLTLMQSALCPGFSPLECAYYIASMGKALAHMHERSVVYRDLKPENVLLDAMGRVRLVDFGFARVLASPHELAETLCGTPDYLSPELVSGHGVSCSADVWALGVVTYELCNGFTPFSVDPTGRDWEEEEEVAEEGQLDPGLSRRICFDPLYLPEDWYDRLGTDFVTSLLRKNPRERPTSREALTHEWFAGLDLARLEHVRPPVHGERLARLLASSATMTMMED